MGTESQIRDALLVLRCQQGDARAFADLVLRWRSRLWAHARRLTGDVHAADDVILTADGPGSDQFRGHMENTGIFRAIATALGLGSEVK